MNRRQALLAFAAGLALAAGSAAAQDLKFPIGEDARFNWKSLEDFKAAHSDLSGQTLTVGGASNSFLSNITLSNEFEMAARTFKLKPPEVHELLVTAARGAFAPASLRAELEEIVR